MTTTRYRDLSAYNAWANRRIFQAAARLAPQQYREDRGAFFRSVHGTLNHLLVTDRIWMRRFTGEGTAPTQLDTILFEELDDLTQARQSEDARIVAFVAALDAPALAKDLHYANMAGTPIVQPLESALDHVFNHQTHHRGQTHALLSHFLGNAGAPSLDLLAFQRESGAGGVRMAAPAD